MAGIFAGALRRQFVGDRHLAEARYGRALSFYVRTKLLLNGFSGAKSWYLDDGTHIRIESWPHEDKITVDVTEVGGEEPELRERGIFMLMFFDKNPLDAEQTVSNSFDFNIHEAVVEVDIDFRRVLRYHEVTPFPSNSVGREGSDLAPYGGRVYRQARNTDVADTSPPLLEDGLRLAGAAGNIPANITRHQPIYSNRNGLYTIAKDDSGQGRFGEGAQYLAFRSLPLEEGEGIGEFVNRFFLPEVSYTPLDPYQRQMPPGGFTEAMRHIPLIRGTLDAPEFSNVSVGRVSDSGVMAYGAMPHPAGIENRSHQVPPPTSLAGYQLKVPSAITDAAIAAYRRDEPNTYPIHDGFGWGSFESFVPGTVFGVDINTGDVIWEWADTELAEIATEWNVIPSIYTTDAEPANAAYTVENGWSILRYDLFDGSTALLEDGEFMFGRWVPVLANPDEEQLLRDAGVLQALGREADDNFNARAGYTSPFVGHPRVACVDDDYVFVWRAQTFQINKSSERQAANGPVDPVPPVFVMLDTNTGAEYGRWDIPVVDGDSYYFNGILATPDPHNKLYVVYRDLQDFTEHPNNEPRAVTFTVRVYDIDRENNTLIFVEEFDPADRFNVEFENNPNATLIGLRSMAIDPLLDFSFPFERKYG